MPFIYFLLLLPLFSFAHQTSISDGGSELFWANPNVPIEIKTNSADLSGTQIRNIISTSMAQWNQSSIAKVKSANSSHNQIKFVSNSPYGRAVLGLTEVSYNNSGVIQKAVITLNDDYQFKAQPGVYGFMEVFLGDVVTHEIGHLFGLSHSEVLDSSMFYSSFSGQSSVAYDDQTAIRQKYDGNSYGKISGIVRGGNSIGVLGAHVQAFSRRTGKATAVVTNEQGDFELGGLDINDTYYLYISPIKNAASLPGYFSNVQTEFCPASYVGSFFSKCSEKGKAQGISLTNSRPEIDVGTVTINCSLKTSSQYNVQKLSEEFTPINLLSFDPQNSNHLETSHVGWFKNLSEDEWSKADRFVFDYSRINDDNLFVKISLVSYALGTQAYYRINIDNGYQDFEFNKGTLLESSLTKTYSTDFETYLPISQIDQENVFNLSIEAKKLPSYELGFTFPSSDTFSSASYLPYFLMVSLWQEVGGQLIPIVNTEVNLSDNLACLDAPYTYATTSSREVKSSSSDLDPVQGAAASCGSLGPPSGGPGASLPLVALGFFMVLFVSNLINTRKKFLS